MKKCDFCAAETYDSVELLKDYINGLIDELKLRTRVRKPTVVIGYIGGGSPTLSLPFLTEFLDAAAECLKLNLREFTIEAMPGTFGIQEADRLKRFGFNRVALGILSLNDLRLSEMGRQYNSEQAVIAYHILRQVGFKNIDVVLALGDDKKLDIWQETVEIVALLHPEHITLRRLDVRENFKECFLWADEFLTLHSYDHYEYGSFALNESRCQYKIWSLLFKKQIGLGTLAETINKNIMERNYEKIEDYLDAVNSEELPVMEKENLDLDRLMLISGLKSFLGLKKEKIPKSALKRYLKEGLFIERDDMIYPTNIGYLLSDAVIEQVID